MADFDDSQPIPGGTTDKLRRYAEEINTLRTVLLQVRLTSLLNIRRAAFSPEIGARYTEKIRANINTEIWQLEEFIERELVASDTRMADPARREPPTRPNIGTDPA